MQRTIKSSSLHFTNVSAGIHAAGTKDNTRAKTSMSVRTSILFTRPGFTLTPAMFRGVPDAQHGIPFRNKTTTALARMEAQKKDSETQGAQETEKQKEDREFNAWLDSVGNNLKPFTHQQQAQIMAKALETLIANT